MGIRTRVPPNVSRSVHLLFSGGPCSCEIPARCSTPPSVAAGMPPSFGSSLDLTQNQVSHLMVKLHDSHLGIGPNRVSHDGNRWHIKPPLNYSVSASLPANTALIDRRAAVRMEQASNDAQLLKGGVTLTSPEVQAQVSTAMAQASAVPVRPFSSSDVGTEVEVAPPLLPPPSVVELALGPVDLRQVVNVKVARPQTTQSMVATAFDRQPRNERTAVRGDHGRAHRGLARGPELHPHLRGRHARRPAGAAVPLGGTGRRPGCAGRSNPPAARPRVHAAHGHASGEPGAPRCSGGRGPVPTDGHQLDQSGLHNCRVRGSIQAAGSSAPAVGSF